MYIIKEAKQIKLAENISLEDGVYNGYFYSWILEINEEKYPTLFGVRHTKQFAKLESFTIKNNCAYR
jgi:hypothetical protein